MTQEELEQRIRDFVGQAFGPPEVGPDSVNEPMIRHWCETMGDANPIYLDPAAAKSSRHGELVAPPTMMQAWTMAGYPMSAGYDAPRDKQQELHKLFNEAGYTGVVATDCRQEYARYLVPGDQVTAHAVIESISEQKTTALGTGYFIETRTRFTDQTGAEVGSMVFRVLKFKPAQPAEARRCGGRGPREAGPDPRAALVRQRLVVGGHRRGTSPDPEVQAVRRAAPPAASDVPRLPLDRVDRASRRAARAP